MLTKKFIALLVLAALTAVSGSMQGHATLRWGIPVELETAADRLPGCNLEIGNWKLRERLTFEERVLKLLRTEAYLKHVYENDVTKETVAIAMFVGPAGSMVVHTPSVCYSANAYQIYSEPRKVTVDATDGSKHELWAITFRADNVHRNYLRVYYGWSDSNGEFQVPRNPRATFAGETFLYRLQVATTLDAARKDAEEDAALRFLRQSHVLQWQPRRQKP